MAYAGGGVRKSRNGLFQQDALGEEGQEMAYSLAGMRDNVEAKLKMAYSLTRMRGGVVDNIKIWLML